MPVAKRHILPPVVTNKSPSCMGDVCDPPVVSRPVRSSFDIPEPIFSVLGPAPGASPGSEFLAQALLELLEVGLPSTGTVGASVTYTYPGTPSTPDHTDIHPSPTGERPMRDDRITSVDLLEPPAVGLPVGDLQASLAQLDPLGSPGSISAREALLTDRREVLSKTRAIKAG
jgi:hypothetical protein